MFDRVGCSLDPCPAVVRLLQHRLLQLEVFAVFVGTVLNSVLTIERVVGWNQSATCLVIAPVGQVAGRRRDPAVVGADDIHGAWCGHLPGRPIRAGVLAVGPDVFDDALRPVDGEIVPFAIPA